MNIALAKQSYGKAKVRLSYVTRRDNTHDFIQIEVGVALEGNFNAAYTDGDNSLVVPTDTMKNSVYGVARLHGVDDIETYAQHLATHFYDSFDQVEQVTISVKQQLWTRIDLDGEVHGHAFTGGGKEENTCTVVSSADDVSMRSGLLGLQVLKTTNSGFEDFHQDKFTTLKPTADRIFATTIAANWPCEDLTGDWTQTRTTVRRLLLDVFAHQFSPSVQKTLYEMAESVLSACPEISEISLDMPNQHHLLADIAKLNLKNDNDIFVPSPEPYGVISATVRRDS